MSAFYVKRKSVLIAGTALLSAIAITLDWVFKLANLKIPFPLAPELKFDLLGIPIILALFLFGFLSGSITCTAAAVSIAVRGPPNALLKFIAEFSTIIGVYIVLRIKSIEALNNQRVKLLAVGSGVTIRVLAMTVANLLLLPLFFGRAFETVLFLLPAFGVFNVLQGVVGALGGLLVYEAVLRRMPSLKVT